MKGGLETLDDFREWLSDNLRYILLGLGAILVLVIAFFAVRLVKSIGSPKQKETEIITEASSEAEGSDKTSKNQLEETPSDLVKDQPEILNLVTKYYTARQEKDYATLKGMCESFDDTVQNAIETQDAAIESYSNIMAYSKNGPEEGTYIVYVYFDVKLTGISTLAPSLRELYVVTDVEGNLMVGNTADVEEYLLERRSDNDVQALVSDVKQKLETAKNADADLKDFVDAQSRGETQSTTDADDSDAAVVVSGTMQSTTELNVRSIPSADGVLYGVLTPGQQVTVLESQDDGWCKISYTVNGTTIEGYVMAQYLSAVE